MVVPLVPMKFHVIIPLVKISSLDVPTVVASTFVEFLSEGFYVISSAPAFGPSKFVKKEEFNLPLFFVFCFHSILYTFHSLIQILSLVS